jgi:hypothetical protein
MRRSEVAIGGRFGKYGGERIRRERGREKRTVVPSVLDGKVEGDVGAERAQGLLIRTKSLMCCRCFMVLRV